MEGGPPAPHRQYCSPDSPYVCVHGPPHGGLACAGLSGKSRRLRSVSAPAVRPGDGGEPEILCKRLWRSPETGPQHGHPGGHGFRCGLRLQHRPALPGGERRSRCHDRPQRLLLRERRHDPDPHHRGQDAGGLQQGKDHQRHPGPHGPGPQDGHPVKGWPAGGGSCRAGPTRRPGAGPPW